MNDYEIRYYDGNDEWVNRIVEIDADVLSYFSIGKTDFLVCKFEGKPLLINKDLIYTVQEIEPEVKGCY